MNQLFRRHIVVLLLSGGCSGVVTVDGHGDGPIAGNIAAKLGDPLPSASDEQLETFDRGKAVFLRRFDLADGLGPAFNLASCGGCHERPAPGGSAGLYRSFFLAASIAPDGTFRFSDSAGMAGGVQRVYHYGVFGPARPVVPADATIFAQRNPIPIFGMGLIAEIPDEEIFSRVDENDADGDGISGRANFDRGFVGRFGRKAQTVSLEGFIRGPLFNHLGVTTRALSDQQRANLPVNAEAKRVLIKAEKRPLPEKVGPHLQIATGTDETRDADLAPDPELSAQDLFDLISFTMLLAAPEFEPPAAASERGRRLFHQANCSACHVPRLNGPRGPIPVYSDLLLHAMGDELADGIEMLEATGREFRTQPLWGVGPVGPYLHDGRAETLEEAILLHGGEAEASRGAFAAYSTTQRADVIEFLLSLGGRSQFSTGLLPPDSPIQPVGDFGGPLRPLSTDEATRFLSGREVFDRDFGHRTGVGALAGLDAGPRFNGDSCRACHFDPVLGGAGPRDVNVMRHGRMDSDGQFIAPADTPNTILHKQIRVGFPLPQAGEEVNVFEHRQTPHTFGLGLIDAIPDEVILANADPEDADGDGIRGRAHVLPDGRIGRFGWKANVPSVAEFARDAMAAELGLTLPSQTGLTFGLTVDDDDVADPELSLGELQDLVFFLTTLAGPPRRMVASEELALVGQGEALFDSIGCAKCHVPSLASPLGDVPLYSDLLLHEILLSSAAGIAEGDASPHEFRTAPLWGLRATAPYFHDGSADTIDQAIRLHSGEAAGTRSNYVFLPAEDRAALLAFLETL